MKIVIAIDSFKGCAGSGELARAIEKGALNIYPGCEVAICPVADGGEGTVEALASSPGARLRTITCQGPLGDPVQASYTILRDNCAVIEMAAASGLPLVPGDKQNPGITTSFGTGELIQDAIARGCRNFIVGIGGSATNDAGLGMLQSLGYGFWDKSGNPVRYAKDLSQIKTIDDTHVLAELSGCYFRVACDVTNPLFGPNGASYVYGPQKGADTAMVAHLDAQHQAFAALVAKTIGKNCSEIPGSGAAGGLGFGFVSFLNAELQSGIQIILEQVGLKSMIETADLVITGEGRIDRQSAMGKVIDGIGSLCKEAGVPCIALAGDCFRAADEIHDKGVTSVFSILSKPMTLDQAMDKETALVLIQKKIEQVLRLIKEI